MNKDTLRLVIFFVLVFLAGLATMRIWDTYRAKKNVDPMPAKMNTRSLTIVNMEEGVVPDGLVELDEPENQIKELTVPSQLSKIDIPEIKTVISRSGRSMEVPENGERVLPSMPQHGPQTTVPAAEPTVAPMPQDTKISMISAPVEPTLIKSLEEYRQFKRRARGSYPVVDFKKQDVLVLESASNLPDKAFEIISAREENGKMVVEYRINVFGLDKKTNTHNVVVVLKRNLPLELKQVL